MNLLEYIKILDSLGVEDLAKRCGTSAGQIRQVAYGNRRANAQLAIAIDKATSGRVPCEDLRPDIDWQYLRDSVAPVQAA